MNTKIKEEIKKIISEELCSVESKIWLRIEELIEKEFPKDVFPGDEINREHPCGPSHSCGGGRLDQ